MLRQLLGTGLLLLATSRVSALTDPFDQDPLTNPEWEYYSPSGAGTTSTDDGFFRVTIPAGIMIDHWNTVDNANQLRRADIPENFIIETRVNFLGSGDPENPVWPPVGEPYGAFLMVYFSQLDCYYFGNYAGTALVLERSGSNGICSVNPGLQEVSLQVVKRGTEYSFSYRANDTDDWTLICKNTALEAPQQVGLMFKTWGANGSEETFAYDYFTIEEVPQEAAAIELPCPFGNPDRAWVDMPYVRPVSISGFPLPELSVTTGPEGLLYDPATAILSGWTPDALGLVPIELTATNTLGSETEAWNVQPAGTSSVHDDEFEEDPTTNAALWQFYEPQTGVQYSIVEDGGSGWWRLDVPTVGDLGQNFDTWIGADRAPQLRREVPAGDTFLIETRLRLAVDALPVETDPFLAGLMVNFNGAENLIHWNIGGLRNVRGANSNVFAERSGINNIANSYVDGLMAGAPVELRLERKCDLYSFFFRGQGQEQWTLAGSYRTADAPQYVGLIMKTWGAVDFGVEFDYFDVVEPGPRAAFTVTPEEGQEPLSVAVDGSASASTGGAITEYAWDFGDGAKATGQVQNHTYTTKGEYTVTLTCTDAAGAKGSISKSVTVLFRPGDVSPWTSTDIGVDPPLVPTGAKPAGEDCYRIVAGGLDIGGRSDQFHFVYQSVAGDASLAVRLSDIHWSSGAKVGAMARTDASPGSPHVSMLFNNTTQGIKLSFVRREVADQSAKLPVTGPTIVTVPNGWAKIERQGDEFIGSYSTDGTTWQELSRVTLVLPETLLWGMAATARDAGGTGIEIDATLCEVDLVGGSAGTKFVRGNANADGVLNITDGIYVLNFLFLGGPTPPCAEAANANGDGTLNITDGIYILNFLFLGGPQPTPPYPDCGEVAEADCASFPPCNP